MQHNENTNLIVMLIYKLYGISCGMFFGYLGYKLFMAGIFEKAGELESVFGKNHLVLKAAAPGTFFAVLGCVIIVVIVWKGVKTTRFDEHPPDAIEHTPGGASYSAQQ